MKRFFIVIQLISIFAFSVNMHASSFVCEDVALGTAGHQYIVNYLVSEVGREPAQILYCEHDYLPRWLLRWTPFEATKINGELWRRYATAVCLDRNSNLDCRVTEHVIVGESHVVVDIEQCDISLEAIAEIHRGVTREYPDHELREVEFMTVLDGGAWSAKEYGYKIKLAELPKFDRGLTRRFLQRCDEAGCIGYDKGREGSWSAQSNPLPFLRRQSGDPLIEYLEP